MVVVGSGSTGRRRDSSISSSSNNKQPYWALYTYFGKYYVTVKNIFHGRSNITCSANCKYRTAAILYTLETWFVSCIIVNTLQKGDNVYYYTYTIIIIIINVVTLPAAPLITVVIAMMMKMMMMMIIIIITNTILFFFLLLAFCFIFYTQSLQDMNCDLCLPDCRSIPHARDLDAL